MSFDVPYAITRRLRGVSPAEARGRVVDALQAEGFGVLTEIDVQATLAKKIGASIAPYVILGACNPQLAHRAIQAEPAIGLLLPCNVVVALDGEDVVVAAASPRAMFGAVEQPKEGAAMTAIAAEAEERLRRALDAL